MVPTNARGAAEIISILRLGVGATLGLIVAGFSTDAVATQFGLGVLFCAAPLSSGVLSWPTSSCAWRSPRSSRMSFSRATGTSHWSRPCWPVVCSESWSAD